MTPEKYLGASVLPLIKAKVDAKQDKLVGTGDGQNIKTINGQDVLGTGDIQIVDKLYTTLGQNTDGALDQKTATDEFGKVNDAIAATNKDVKWVKEYPAPAQTVATHAELPASGTEGEVVEVTADETLGGKTYYYIYTEGAWQVAGPEMPYYRKSEADNKFATKTELGTVNGDVESLLAYSETTVQLDTKVADDKTSTVTLVKTTAPLNNATNTTDTSIALPVASATEAGVVNPATYQSIQESAEKIEIILGGSVSVENLPAAPTQEELTEAWKTATGKTELINGAKILDSTNNKTWTYYSNANTWSSIDNANPVIELKNFTNDAAGQIKGDNTTDGKVVAEADGTGSVKGWDTLTASVSTNASAIETINTNISNLGDTYALKSALETTQAQVTDNAGDIAALDADKQAKLVGSGEGQNIKTVNGQSLLGTGDIEIAVPQAMTVDEFNAAWNGTAAA